MFRFMLGNTKDFLATKGRLPLASISSLPSVNLALLDRWCIGIVGKFCVDCLDVYYPEHRYEAVIATSDRLVTTISTTYFNAVKDT